MSGSGNADAVDIVRLVNDLLEQVSGTVVTECEFQTGTHRVFFRRSPLFVPRIVEAQTADDTAIPEHWHAVCSPLTGIYYTAETPQSPPFVTIGAAISVGQSIGLIEAMKTFNRVESEVAGIVRSIVASNGAEVQSGQTLLYVELVGAS